MKHLYSLGLFLSLVIFTGINTWGQLSPGDIAFTAFNADGDDDFAIVTFVDIPANTTIYFTDEELDGTGNLITPPDEGILRWETGGSIITAGTVVVFTDVTSALGRTASVGTITLDSLGATFNIAATGDAIIAYQGSNAVNPNNYIAGIQNEFNNYGSLNGTGLVENDTFINFQKTTNPDGGVYTGPRVGYGTYAEYRALMNDNNNWTEQVSNGELILPISTSSFILANTWTGATSSAFGTASNWSLSTVPGASDYIIIPSGLSNYPTINSPITINSMRIASGASVIANATVTGNVTYNRNLSTANWYLVSSPVSGETIEDLIANHTFATGTGSNIGIADFSNSGAAWNYQTAASTGALNSGQGYSVKLNTAGTLSFSGSMNSTNVNRSVSLGSRNNFNLVGNPFTAYVNSTSFASANTAALTEETIWLWNGTQYVTFNAVSPIEIAPAQGFFVEAIANSSITFNTANQSHQTGTFLKQTPIPSFELFAESGNDKESTRVFYVDNKTTGFDNGYDSKMFSGVTSDFSIFTHLVSNDEGNKLAIQTLPNADYETMIIPLGLTADANKEITLSVASQNLPNGLEIYLEDRVNNTFVNLSEGAHTFITNSAINGIGQYYIHVTSARLSNEDIVKNLANVSIYTSDKNEITITGLQEKATVSIHSILGEELVKTKINSNGISKVQLPNLATGIYVVKLNSVLGNITKKIILE